MAEIRPGSLYRVLPRLPDCLDPLHDACPDPNTLEAETATWYALVEWLPVGWYLAPPRYVDEARGWFCAAYNVRGCLKDTSFDTGTGRTAMGAIIELSCLFEGSDDELCVRAQHRRPT